VYIRESVSNIKTEGYTKILGGFKGVNLLGRRSHLHMSHYDL